MGNTETVTFSRKMFARHGLGPETVEKKSLASSYGPDSQQLGNIKAEMTSPVRLLKATEPAKMGTSKGRMWVSVNGL
jgi:hypothetical protein